MKKTTLLVITFLSALIASHACLPGEEIPDSPSGGVVDEGGGGDTGEGEAEKISSTIFTPGESGYAFFRIPAAVISSEGTILVFAEGRVDNAEDYGNIDIVLKRSTDNGRTWSDLIVVKDDAGNTCGNPAPVALESGKIILVYNLAIPDQLNTVDDVTYVTESTDDGLTWSTSRSISGQIKDTGESNFHPGPVHGIVKQYNPHKGRIIIPVWGSSPRAFIIYSDDGGTTWQKGAKMDYEYANESTVAELLDGRLEAPRAAVPGAFARECARQGLAPVFRPKDLFAARLSEVNRWLAGEETRLGALRTLALPSPEAGHGAALSALETARGALFAAVETDGSRIVRAGFLAPTEWSMREDGLPLVWAQHFLAARGDDPRLKERLETLFAAFDPCTDLVWEDRHA